MKASALTSLAFAGLVLLGATPAQAIDRPRATDDEYPFVGKVIAKNSGKPGDGTGTLITPRGVLTFAPLIYSLEHGFAEKVEFERGRNRGRILSSSTVRGSRMFVLAGYVEFANKTTLNNFNTLGRAIAGIKLRKEPAGGDFEIGYKGPKILFERNYRHVTSRYITTFRKWLIGYGDRTSAKKNTLMELELRSGFKKKVPGYYQIKGAQMVDGMLGGPVYVEYIRESREPNADPDTTTIIENFFGVFGVIVGGKDGQKEIGVRFFDDEIDDFIDQL